MELVSRRRERDRCRQPFGSKFLFPRTDGVTGYHDITPRMGAAIDVFGNGKTSVKLNVSKYLQAAQ